MKKLPLIISMSGVLMAANGMAMDLGQQTFERTNMQNSFYTNQENIVKVNPARANYVTIGYGLTTAPESKISSMDANPDIYTYKSQSSNLSGVNLAIGHIFENHLGVEFDYTHYMSASSSYHTTLPIDPTVQYSTTQTSSANEKDLLLTYAVPLGSNFQLFAKAGYGDLTVKNHYVAQTTIPGASAPEQTLDKTINNAGLKAALGLQYVIATRYTVGFNVGELFAKQKTTSANLAIGVLF